MGVQGTWIAVSDMGAERVNEQVGSARAERVCHLLKCERMQNAGYMAKQY